MNKGNVNMSVKNSTQRYKKGKNEIINFQQLLKYTTKFVIAVPDSAC